MSGGDARPMNDLRMHESGSAYLYELELPPVDPDTIAAEVDDGCVTVSGGVDADPEFFGKGTERSSVFCRRIVLPGDADCDNVRAILTGAVLELRAPKRAEGRRRLVVERAS